MAALRKVLFAVALCAIAAPGVLGEVSYPPALPGGRRVATDRSDAFLEPPAALKDVERARTPPTVDFLYYPGQTYKGNPWSNWGDGVAANGRYYSAIGVITPDLNLDGWPDLFVSGSNRLFLSRGHGTYREGGSGAFHYEPINEEATPCGVAAGDLDRDGDLDIVVVDHSQPARQHLFLNQGLRDGVPAFRDATQQAGLARHRRRRHLARRGQEPPLRLSQPRRARRQAPLPRAPGQAEQCLLRLRPGR